MGNSDVVGNSDFGNVTSHPLPWQNDLTYMRIDTKRFEILVAPFWGEVSSPSHHTHPAPSTLQPRP